MSVHTARGVLTFASHPVQTQRAHYSTKTGDSEWSIRHTGHKASGSDRVKAQDFNTGLIRLWFTPSLAKALGIPFDRRRRILVSIGSHWPDLFKNGWRYDEGAPGGSRTKINKNTTIQHWVDAHGGTYEALKRLERKNGDKILLFVEAIRIAKEVGVVLTPEAKSQGYRFKSGMATLVEPCRRENYPCWIMALLSMKYAQSKCYWAEELGGHFALIFGRFRRQARGANKVKHWKRKPSIIWGPSSARKWILAA